MNDLTADEFLDLIVTASGFDRETLIIKIEELSADNRLDLYGARVGIKLSMLVDRNKEDK
jgi:hypothetical protein